MTDLRRWPEADALLDRALDLPAAERTAFIDREAARDPELARALRAVLAEAERDDGFLDRSGPGLGALISEAWAEAQAPHAPTLEPGDRFTTYEVLDLIGRGGMGEVYRARDERLGRLVALKVLPQAFVRDRQRLARFDREARLLASLNHPNIAAIYGLAEDRGRQALVLEYVEGTTLAARLAGGPLPLRDALPIARQIALALEAAHRRGIVHRDLKPANVCLMADGTVKVLDFGLAKAVAGEGAGGADDLTSVHGPGRIVGTPAYMAPEQARGAEIDRRADIWAFGCLLYEMLSGLRAFDGEHTQEVLSRVLEREPDFGRLPSATPDAVHRLLRRALAKDPRKRLADLGDAALELEEAVRASERSFRGRLTHWGTPLSRAAAAIAVLLAGVAAGVLLPRLWRSEAPPVVLRLAVPVPSSDELQASVQQVAALSPDGRTIVYRASRGGVVRLFRRTLDGLQSDPLAGTEYASGPFFSPDGSWVGFDGDGMLQKVSLSGGSPVPICPASGGANASWGGDTIVFATETERVLRGVPASGGAPQPLTALDETTGEIAHAFPDVLPSGQAVLFTIVRPAERHVAVLRMATREVRVLTTGSQPRYVRPGYLVFARGDTLWAAPFDERTLSLTGDPVPVLEGLDTAGGAAVHFAAGADGSLVYAPRREEVRERHLVWLDRQGAVSPSPFEPKRYARAALAPGGRRVALAFSERDNTDVWIGDLERGALTRLTREPTTETAPIWTPDGRAIVFRSDRDGGGLFRQRLEPGARAERLTRSGNRLHTAHGWSPDGRTLLFTEFSSYATQSIMALEAGTPEPRTLLNGRFARLRPQVSPDGRWMAYQSDESGRFEIHVRPFPDVTGAAWQVSLSGGISPRWAHSGRELFYYDGTSFVSAAIETSGPFAVRERTRLFAYAPFGGRLGPDYDVSADDRRFLMIRSGGDTPATRLQLVLVQHWIEELKAKLRR